MCIYICVRALSVTLFLPRSSLPLLPLRAPLSFLLVQEENCKKPLESVTEITRCLLSTVRLARIRSLFPSLSLSLSRYFISFRNAHACQEKLLPSSESRCVLAFSSVSYWRYGACVHRCTWRSLRSGALTAGERVGSKERCRGAGGVTYTFARAAISWLAHRWRQRRLY